MTSATAKTFTIVLIVLAVAVGAAAAFALRDVAEVAGDRLNARRARPPVRRRPGASRTPPTGGETAARSAR